MARQNIRKRQSCRSQTGSNRRVWVASVSHRCFFLSCYTPQADPGCLAACLGQMQMCRAGTVPSCVCGGAWTFWPSQGWMFFPSSRELRSAIEQLRSICSPNSMEDLSSYRISACSGFVRRLWSKTSKPQSRASIPRVAAVTDYMSAEWHNAKHYSSCRYSLGRRSAPLCNNKSLILYQR